jgi:predicted PurR-regulated permease PerM
VPSTEQRATRPRAELGIGLAAVALLTFVCLLILRPFITAALWAAILCFTTWPWFARLERMLGGRRSLAAMVATLTLIVIVAAPVAILAMTLADNVAALAAATQRLIYEGPPNPPAWVANVPLVGGHLADYWNRLAGSTTERFDELAKVLPVAKRFVLDAGRTLGQGISQIVLSLLIAFFFYRDGETAARRLMVATSRILGDEGSRLLQVAGATIHAVVYGILGTALVQGVLAAIGFEVAGVPGAVLLGFATSLVSPIPGGTHVISLPAAFWLYHQGSTGWAIFMLVWGTVVGSIDNVVRPFLISRGGATMPLILIILGVLGGAMALGLIGLFLGPTLLAVGYSLLEEWSAPAIRRERG